MLSTRQPHDGPDVTPAPVPAIVAGHPVTQVAGAATAAALVQSFLSGRSPRTLAAYRQDLEDFRAFVGAMNIDGAASLLLSRAHGEANALGLSYRADLLKRGLSPATVNRRLSALRSLAQLGRVLGWIPWALEVQNVAAESYRDTRGPSPEELAALLAAAAGDTPKGRRDRALLWVLFNPALRRAEASALDMGDVELGSDGMPRALQVLGKGKRQKKWVRLPALTARALAGWLQVRGLADGPLFRSLDPVGKGDGRLTGAGVYAIVRELGRRAGVGHVRPHGLRHAGITTALDAGVDVRKVKEFSRHAKLETLLKYDDNRQDFAGQTAERIDRHMRRVVAS